MKKTIIFLTCLVSSILTFSAWAQTELVGKGNIKLGPLEIHPSIAVTETYTDNVYLSYDGKKDENDWITTVSPGIKLVLPLSRHSIKVGYYADINYFKDYDENDYVRQVGFASLNLDFPGGLTVEITDRFTDSEVLRKWKDQPGLSGAADPYRDKPYQANDFLAKAKYIFADRWAVAAWYNNYKYEYDHRYDKSGNYDRDLIGTSLFYRFTAKTEALLEYQYSKIDYPDNEMYDNSNNAVYVGLGFDPKGKLNGYLKVGWAEKDYDEDRDEDRIDTFSTQIDLAYNISPYDVVKLKAIRTIEEDIDTNQPFTREDYSIGYSRIIASNERIRLNAQLGYGKDDYEGEAQDTDGAWKKRKEDIYYATLGIEYAMQRWLMWNLSYTYLRRDSNFIRYDYDENRVFLKGTIYF
ncbi:MAG: outer membrane beta-barrel protein [Syntrophaceae bacterium]|nr:outer membrane beta-barrel protein [Syntrophaceae bacterium]